MQASVWYGATLRADTNRISIGAGTNVQDRTIIKATPENPTSVGSNVTIGHSAVLVGCTVGDTSLIGMGSSVLEGATVRARANCRGPPLASLSDWLSRASRALLPD